MKTNLLKTLLVGAALMLGLGASAQTERFYVGVTGYDNNHQNPYTIYATMYDNFAFSIKLPDPNAKIGSTYADINMRMTGVTTLGLGENETRTYESHYNTGVVVSEQLFNVWFPQSYALADNKIVSVPVTVVDYIDKSKHGGKHSFTYSIAGVEKTQIVGAPSSTDDALKAWEILTNEVITEPRPIGDRDSKFILKEGAYLQIGNERLTCTQDVDLLPGGDWVTEPLQNQFANVEYSAVTTDTKKAVLFLPKGSAMKVDESMATLKNDGTMTFDCSNMADGALNGLISEALGAESTNNSDVTKKISIQKALQLFDKIVGLINAAGVVPCTIQFGEPTTSDAFITVYPGSSNVMENQTLAQFAETRASYPNAIGFVTEDHAADVEDVKNIVVEYSVGKNDNKYYECEELVLTDKKDFYTPVNFIAHAGDYSRTIYKNSNTCCVPFALDKNSFSSDVQLLTFAYYEPINDGGVLGGGNAYAYFNSNEVVNGGIPCFIYSVSNCALNVSFEDTEIVAEPEGSSNLHGFYRAANDLTDSYGINSNGDKLATATRATAFRSVLTLTWDEMFNGGSNHTGASAAKEIKIAIIGEDGNATSIDGVELGKKEVENIYTINGVKVSKISNPGLYIVNGVKRFVK